MSTQKVKHIAESVVDDAAREAILALCTALDKAQREIDQLKQEVKYIKVHYYPK